MQVCGMTQLDVQCAACSLRLCERLASRLAHSAEMYYYKDRLQKCLGSCAALSKTRSRLSFLVSYIR